MTETVNGGGLSREALASYLGNLVNLLFKILPMRESNEETLSIYIDGLQRELIGFEALFSAVDNDPGLVDILAIIRYLADHPDCSVKKVRYDVFRAISICNKLKARYTEV